MTGRPIALDELRRAYQAVQDGEFHSGARPAAFQVPLQVADWAPAASQDVRLVLGAHSGAGASTVALALATVLGASRVVECCTVGASGLAGAADAELGVTGSGWVQGARGDVMIERRGDHISGPDRMPAPEPTSKPATIIDAAGDVSMLAGSAGWIGDLVRSQPQIVIVARPTGPGMRRLEAAISVLGVDRCQPVLVAASRRWTRAMEQAAGPHVRELHAAGRIVLVPAEIPMAQFGLTPEPLPAAVLAACSLLVTQPKGTPK